MAQTVLATIVALAIVGATETSKPLEALVGSYIEIQTLLAADKVEGIVVHARAISTEARRLGRDGAPIEAAAKTLEQAGDLEAARKAFGTLSTAVIAAAAAAGWKNLDDVKLAYCPMADGSWLQKDAKIRNPYYGSSMLECGVFKEK